MANATRKDAGLASRRSALTAAVGLATGAALARPALAQQRDFVVAGNGDPYETMWRRALIPEFERQTGLRVVWAPGLSAQILARLVAQRSRPQVDVALIDEGPFIQASDIGLWEPMDRARLGDTSQITPAALEYPQGIAYGFSSIGLYYNSDAFAQAGWEAPASWLDMLKPELNRKITMLSANNSAGLNSLLALNAVGGGSTPDNMEPGFDLARRIGRQCLTIDNFGDTSQLVQQRTAIAGIWVQQRVVAMAETGMPLRFVGPREGVWGHRFMGGIVKGRPAANIDAAKTFLALMLTREQQAAALSLNPLPVHLGAASQQSAAIVRDIHLPDQRVIQQHRAAWTERWSKEVERR